MCESIALIGYRGSGKTQVAKALADKLNNQLISIDEEIEKKIQKSIKEFVNENGWAEFRKIESEIIKKICNNKNTIIDCGGGIIQDRDNIDELRKISNVVWLKTSKQEIKSRIKDSDERPSLSTDKSHVEEVDELLYKREPLYKKASNIIINTDNKSIESISDEIITSIHDTKICIPITATTTDSASIDITEAYSMADIIELRIDYINDIDNQKLGLLMQKCNLPIIVTCRPSSLNGKFKGPEQQRLELLRTAIKLNAHYVDIESESDKDTINELLKNKNGTRIIISHHDFKQTPEITELNKIYNNIKTLNPDLIKIVTKANSLNDNFKIFELLNNKNNLISLCMGLKGQISRVLAPKYGSRITYAALEKNKESAPGQLTIKELNEDYHIKKINKDTKLLGVIGKFAENSKSRFMQNAMFVEKDINAVYHPLKLDEEDLDEFIKHFRNHDFIGSAVTIPHKLKIMDYLDEIDETAKEIGAINTIVKKHHRLIGYNTDYYGAVQALKEQTEINNKKIIIIGAGGGARAIIYGLMKENANITIVNRTEEKAKILSQDFNCSYDQFNNLNNQLENNEIIINTTSVGMRPNQDKSISDKIPKERIVMDIVYTPIQTKLIKIAKDNNCTTITGERMLIYQAMKQFKLWTGLESNFKVMEQAIMKHIGE